MEIRISVDDGSVEDLKVLEYLKKYNLCDKTTFYIALNNSQIKIMNDNDIFECSKYVDIGGHNYDHITTNLLDDCDQLWQMIKGKKYLECVAKREIKKYAPTRGWHNPRMIENAKKVGFTEFRTMKQGQIEKTDDFVQNITVHFHPSHIDKFDNLFTEAKNKENGYCHLTCHGWEIEKFKMWDKFEKILKKLCE